MAFVAQHHPVRGRRVENGSQGQILHADHGLVIVQIDGTGRQVTVSGDDLGILRLGYAHHVYRQQGATVEHAVIVTGGWQTSKESAYVHASRARNGPEWYVARDELGEEGQDSDRITKLAQKMRKSSVSVPSVGYRSESASRTVGRAADATFERELLESRADVSLESTDW